MFPWFIFSLTFSAVTTHTFRRLSMFGRGQIFRAESAAMPPHLRDHLHAGVRDDVRRAMRNRLHDPIRDQVRPSLQHSLRTGMSSDLSHCS